LQSGEPGEKESPMKNVCTTVREAMTAWGLATLNVKLAKIRLKECETARERAVCRRLLRYAKETLAFVEKHELAPGVAQRARRHSRAIDRAMKVERARKEQAHA
jgi:hypothetical protein